MSVLFVDVIRGVIGLSRHPIRLEHRPWCYRAKCEGDNERDKGRLQKATNADVDGYHGRYSPSSLQMVLSLSCIECGIICV
jgi:hypothetical protein